MRYDVVISIFVATAMLFLLMCNVIKGERY
jgi:hypothetical protein